MIDRRVPPRIRIDGERHARAGQHARPCPAQPIADLWWLLNLLPVDEYSTAGRRIHARNGIEHRGLARAIRSDERKDLASVDADTDIIYCGQTAETQR